MDLLLYLLGLASIGLTLACELVFVFWCVNMVKHIYRAIFKKDKLTFRKTIDCVLSKGNAVPKHKMIVALVFPLIWMFGFYNSDEHVFQYVERIANGTGRGSDWFFTLTFAVSFYLWAGHLAYDGVPDKRKED